MIDAVSSISSVSALQYVRKAAAVDEVFRIPESALRTSDVAPAQGVAERDPAVDSVELSRDFPQMVMGATYAPPPVDQMMGLSRGGNARGLETEQDATSGYSEPEELSAEAGEAENPEAAAGETAEGENTDEAAKSGDEKGANGEKLDEAQQKQVQELKARDREVRAHEQAHKSVGGSLSGGISFEYQQGPDGQKYAVGGEVSIDTSAEKTPEATIAKMQQVKAAAMAPAQPSDQDRAVAAQATQAEAQARQEMAAANKPGSAEESGETDPAAESEGSGIVGDPENAEGVNGAAAASSANNTDTSRSANSAGNAAGASPVSGASAENETNAPASSGSVPFGGIASLSSANPFMSRYAGNAYGAQSFAAAAMSMSSYAPINIVA